MRIAMIGRALPRLQYAGGVSGQMHSLASALVRRGHEVTAFALNPPGEPVDYQYQKIPAPKVVMTHPKAALYLAPLWVSSLPLDHFDIVHTHGDDHFLSTRRPVVRTFYGTAWAEAQHSLNLKQRLYHLSMVPLERISERRATMLVAISKSTQQQLSRPSTIIPCGYDPAVFSPQGEKSAEPSILFVGDLGTRKRGDLLLREFTQRVLPVVPTAELWMVTTDRVTAPGVRWFGRVTTSALAQLYSTSWVFCLPSTYEGFGVPYLEAMASGTVAVGTPNGGAEEVLAEDAGCLVTEHDLAAGLVRLLGDANGRAVLAARGLERAKTYEISRVAAQYEMLYEQLVATAPFRGVVREGVAGSP
jgi:phosphatidyl-myo-inositol alpha-mannosyltransferase